MVANEVKLRLKIMVDLKAEKVVFAEVGKDFVDFLFNILSLPLTTVVKLLNNKDMPGSLPGLYKSVESLKTEYFQPQANKDIVLQPKHSVVIPLLSPRHTYYNCGAGNVGIVTKTVTYMVMDNLEVMPMSVSLIKSLGINFDSLVEEEVEFGLKEGLELLRASLAGNEVLTTVFFGTKMKIRQQVQRINKSFSRVLMSGVMMYFGCFYECLLCMKP